MDVKGKDNEGWNALHWLCYNNSSKKLTDAMQLLIQHGIDVKEKDNNGVNALHLLCWNNSNEKLVDAIQLLIQLGIDVESDGINARSLLRENPQYMTKNQSIEEMIKVLDSAAYAN